MLRSLQNFLWSLFILLRSLLIFLKSLFILKFSREFVS